MKAIYLLALVLPILAQAETREETLVTHLARRVADKENERGLPSRAVWLGSRVVKNSKAIAVQTPAKKAPITNKN